MRKEWRSKIGKGFDFLVIASIAIQQLLVPATRANAFPIYAQQAYKNPREANGRIVCANCHLASKTVELEAPQSDRLVGHSNRRARRELGGHGVRGRAQFAGRGH